MRNLNKKLDYIGFQMHPPSNELEPYIQCYWSVNRKEELSQPATNKIISDGGMGVVFNFGHSFSLSIGGELYTDANGCFVTGPTKMATYLEFDKKVDAVGIRFNPGGAYPFLQNDISNLQDKFIPASENDLLAVGKLYKPLKATKSIKEKTSLLDGFLLEKLHVNRTVPSSWMVHVIGIIQEHNGSLKINDLCNQLNISRRHFERKFKNEVGLLPKLFSRIIRIEKSRATIRSLEFKSLTDVGLENDYFDQAHFSREFKTFVEETPKQYFNKKKQMSLLYNS